MPKLEKSQLFDNRYILLKKLGAGGFSEVWLAHDNKADMEIALKVFAPDKGMDEKGIELFSREYSLVFNLNQANLLKPSHYNDYEGSPYLVLPYCKNGSALELIGEMTEHELGKFMLHAASALDYLHDQNPPIIHQDIKPDNFLIDDKGNYLLADFGISSRIKRVLTRSVGRQNSSGTLPYMPPEKFIKERQVIKASDIFSLGVTFYELLTGELPFGEHGGLLLNTGAEVPDLPSKFSKELNRLIETCLAKEPWDRPRAEELIVIAGDYLKTGKWNIDSIIKKIPADTIPTDAGISEEIQIQKEGRKTEKFVPAETSPKSEIPLPPVNLPKSKPPKKSKALPIILISVVALIVIIVLAIIFFNNRSSTTEPINDRQKKINDSIVKAKQNDSIKKSNLTKARNDSLKLLAEVKNKKEGNEDNKQTKKETVEKVSLPSINCYGRTLYVSPVNNSTYATYTQAWSICNNLKSYGYDDWYLPSKDELNCLFDGQVKIGGFESRDYWSSNGSGDYAWNQDFNDGHQYNTDKQDHGFVRCVRK